MGMDKAKVRFEQTERQSSELAAMLRMLAVSEGTFSFSIAICNSPYLQKYLVGELVSTSESIEVVEINEKTEDVLQFVAGGIPQNGHITAIFITGMEKVLPSDEKDHRVLRVLNTTRELWKSHYSCPVVFWVPEYVATLFSTRARDVWSWVSHIFEFVSEEAAATAGTRDIYAGDITGAGSLDAVQKRFRIAELEQRIKDASKPLKDELVPHLLVWLNELSYIYHCIGELDAAEQMLMKSLEINERLGRQEGMASDYGNLGLIYQTRGELDKAEEMHRKSLEIDERLGRQEGMASNYGNLGLIYRTRGELDKAEEMLRKSLEIDERLGRQEGMANQYGNLGLIYEQRGDVKKAKEYWQKAAGLYKKIGMAQEAAKVQGWIDEIDRGSE